MYGNKTFALISIGLLSVRVNFVDGRFDCGHTRILISTDEYYGKYSRSYKICYNSVSEDYVLFLHEIW